MSFFRRAGSLIARIFQSAGDPAAEPDVVQLYAKDAAGVSQLFARSDNGTVHQITPPTSSNLFVWQAGVPWATIYAQMVAVTGPKICLVAYDPAAPGNERQMTDNGGAPTFISDVYFWGLSGPGQSQSIFISVKDGFKLGAVTEIGGRQIGRLMSKNIGWDIRNSTSGDVFTPIGAGYAEFEIDGGYITGLNTFVTGKSFLTLQNKAQAQGFGANGLFRPTANGSFCTMRGQSSVTSTIYNSVGGPFSVNLDIDTTCTVSAAMFVNATRILQNMNTIVRDVGTGQRYAITVVAGVLTVTAVS